MSVPDHSETHFRALVRAALSGSVASDGRSAVLWSNAPGSTANEAAAQAYREAHAASTLTVAETEAGQAVLALLEHERPSPEQLDVVWGLVSHRFVLACEGDVHAFVQGSPMQRVFRAVEVRELSERRGVGSVLFHEDDGVRAVCKDVLLADWVSHEGDFFVTRDPDEQIVIMEEAEAVRPRRAGP